jgi:hypothetical protein
VTLLKKDVDVSPNVEAISTHHWTLEHVIGVLGTDKLKILCEVFFFKYFQLKA